MLKQSLEIAREVPDYYTNLEMGQPYDLGRTHLEMGQRLGDRAHLEQAATLFADIGAEWDLRRARGSLAPGPKA